MTTHFHLLVRSPTGELSEALRRSQNEYSRFFNRRHRRDGALIRGRFFSKPVTSLTYRRALVRYIDANPVRARIVAHTARYPYGSAAQYARPAGPPWLERSWVDAEVRSAASGSGKRRDEYERAFPPLGQGSIARIIERRIDHGRGNDSLDDLVGAAPRQVRLWMERKTRLADGMAVGQPICDAVTLQAILERECGRSEDWKSHARPRLSDLWKIVEVALLRDLAGLTWAEIAQACACSSATSHARYRSHAELLKEEPGYAKRASELASSAVESCFEV